MRRPSLFFLVTAWTGLLCGDALGASFSSVIVPLVAFGIGLPVFRDRRMRLAILATAFFLIGILRSPEASWNRVRVPPELGSAIKVPVVLKVETPFLAAECSDRVSAEVREVTVGPTALEGRKVMLRGFEKVTPPGRSRFTVCGKFQPPKAKLNPYGMDMRTQNMRLGVVGAVDISAIADEPGHGLVARFSSFRERLEGLILASYPGEASGMLAAMLLGQRTTISPHVQTVMLKAGTYHVIAVSGLHVVIVLMVLSAFLSVFGLPRVILVAIYAAAVVFYIIFTGTPPSAVRAGGLFLVASLCRLLQWKTDFTNTVCAAGTIMLLMFPYFAWDIGFQLSLGAVIGMTVLVPQLDPPSATGSSILRRAVKYATSGFMVCLAAQAFTLPIVLYDFGRTSLVAPAGNFIMVPLTTLAIAGGIEASFALLISENLAVILLKAAAFVTHVSIFVTDIITRLPHALVFSGRPGLVRIIAYCCGLAFLSFGMRGMKKHIKLLLLLGLHGLLIFPFPQRADHVMRLTFLYVGDGDAVLVETPGGGRTLIDAGPNTEVYGQAQNQVMRFLAMKAIGRLDRVIVSHPHDDHYGGLVSLLENFQIGEIVVGDLAGEADYEQLLERARTKGVNVRVTRAGDAWQSGGASFEVLHSGEGEATQEGKGGESGEDPNANSVVLRLTFGRAGFMFTGDVTPDVQGDLAASVDSLRCEVLKVPHHGARAWIDAGFLKRLGARFAIISVGSKFASHPSPATIAFLENSGVRTFTTNSDGAITIVTDGQAMELKTESGTCITYTASGRAD
jgi:competence protein ComEC